MSRKKIAEIIKTGRILVSDGAWGTFLHSKGLKAGECPELWCVERPGDVKDIALSYINAGADMVQTNSFGGNPIKLAQYGLDTRTAEINEAAARLSREAAGDDKWVIASAGPTGRIIYHIDALDADEAEEYAEDPMYLNWNGAYEAFKTQAAALEAGGADAVCVETMSGIDEAEAAVRAVRENTKLEVICTFTFEKNNRGEYRTMTGVTPQTAFNSAIGFGADIAGANCGSGIEQMIEVVRLIRAENKSAPIIVHANAGLPQNINGIDIFPESPEEMAAHIPDIAAAGAVIIGGCCGTTPEHIAAIKKAVTAINQKNQ